MNGIDQAGKIRTLITEQVDLLAEERSYIGILKIKLKIFAMKAALEAAIAAANY